MEERKWKVYVHQNVINGKMYVGITKQIPKYRWKKDGKGYSKNDNLYFYNAIQKYEWDGFSHEVISSNLTKEEAESFERTLIKELGLTNRDKGYNIQNGGCSCGVHSDEVRQKLSKMKKGVPTGLCGKLSGVSKEIDVYSVDGTYIESFETLSLTSVKYRSDISNISYCCSGKIKTSNGYIFRYKDDPFDKYDTIHKTRARKIACLDLKTKEIIKIYESLEQAMRQTGVAKSTMVKYCNNKVKRKKGFDWRYIN